MHLSALTFTLLPYLKINSSYFDHKRGTMWTQKLGKSALTGVHIYEKSGNYNSLIQPLFLQCKKVVHKESTFCGLGYCADLRILQHACKV